MAIVLNHQNISVGLTCYIINDELHNISTIEQYIENANDYKIAGTATNPRLATKEINKLKPEFIFSRYQYAFYYRY